MWHWNSKLLHAEYTLIIINDHKKQNPFFCNVMVETLLLNPALSPHVDIENNPKWIKKKSKKGK